MSELATIIIGVPVAISGFMAAHELKRLNGEVMRLSKEVMQLSIDVARLQERH